jgi:trehalose/maltose transport system permease protein
MAEKSSGLSELAKKEERLAWLLLVPTLIVIVLIAFYPLGSVFVSSFTNRTFASSAPTEGVGFENYRLLLSMTIEQLEPVIDPETGQQEVNPRTGEPVYELAVQVLPREPYRYRPSRSLLLASLRHRRRSDFILSVGYARLTIKPSSQNWLGL